MIPIQDADTFFPELAEKVFALDEYSKPHQLSAKVAAVNVKKYIVDERDRIRLHDMVIQEMEKVYRELTGENFPADGVPFSQEELRKRVALYESFTEILRAMMITGCYWGKESHDYLWLKCLERAANPSGPTGGSDVWLNLHLYPALLLLYAAGIASIAAERYGFFSALLTKATRKENGEDQPLVLALYPSQVMEPGVQRQLPGMEKRHTPLSDHLYNVLRVFFREILPQEIHYQRCFDQFEYLLALVHGDLAEKITGDIWGPRGCFIWRKRRRPDSIIKVIELEAEEAGNSWPPLKAGLFDGQIERFQFVKSQFDASLPYV